MSHSAFACIKAAPIFSQLPDVLIEELVNISIHQKNMLLAVIFMSLMMICLL